MKRAGDGLALRCRSLLYRALKGRLKLEAQSLMKLVEVMVGVVLFVTMGLGSFENRYFTIRISWLPYPALVRGLTCSVTIISHDCIVDDGGSLGCIFLYGGFQS